MDRRGVLKVAESRAIVSQPKGKGKGREIQGKGRASVFEAEGRIDQSSSLPASGHNVEATTIMICNLPCSIMREELVHTIDSMGLTGRYDFLNLPCHHQARPNVGYAFINFLTAEDAALCTRHFTGFRFPNTRSTKVCTVKPARIQGAEANVRQLLTSRKSKGAVRLSIC